MKDFKVRLRALCAIRFSNFHQADQARVWRGLVDQLSTWWLPDFHMLGTDSIVVLEPHGRWQTLRAAGGK